MAIIDNTYFRNDIKLPQVGSQFQQSDVDTAIDIYQAEILKLLLGYRLYNLLITAWSAFDVEQPATPTPLPTRFDSLINGAEFSFNFNGDSVNTKWEGLRNIKKISLISYYTHYSYLNNNESRTFTTGQGKTVKENAREISVRPKIVYSFNRCVDLYGKTPKQRDLRLSNYYNIRKKLRYRTMKEIMSGFFLDHCNYEHWDIEPSAYNFLLANISDYPEWVFSPIYKINTLGI